MHNIDELEERWTRYNRKRILIYVLLGLSVALAISVMYAGQYNSPNQSNSKLANQQVVIDPEPPSTRKRRVEISYREELPPAIAAKVKKKRTINLKVSDKVITKESIEEIENRFHAKKEPKDSMYLAKYYYKNGDYRRAEQWALATNRLDSGLEESWLVFAKSKAKQGNIEDAIRVLKAFSQSVDSPKAEELMSTIGRGAEY